MPSTVVGTAVFITLEHDNIEPWVKVAVGLTSVLAAVLAGLQTWLAFGERADKHRLFGARYGAYRTRLQVIAALPKQATGAYIRTSCE